MQVPALGTYNHAVMFAQLDNHMIVMWKNSPTDEDQVRTFYKDSHEIDLPNDS